MIRCGMEDPISPYWCSKRAVYIDKTITFSSTKEQYNFLQFQLSGLPTTSEMDEDEEEIW